LIIEAKEYKKEDVLKSITRNSHMNDYDGEEVKETTIDAILVDFINYIAAHQGVDLALYTRDMEED
jgi:CRISPR/Cas system endoribonuclease Cas6 (RAMP superfamily)